MGSLAESVSYIQYIVVYDIIRYCIANGRIEINDGEDYIRYVLMIESSVMYHSIDTYADSWLLTESNMSIIEIYSQL